MRRRSMLVAVMAGALLAACGSDGTAAPSAACPATILYGGNEYVGQAADVAPEGLGRELGEAQIPACNDSNDASEQAEATVAAEIVGVSPEVAVAVTYDDKVIFISRSASLDSLPAEVQRMLRP